MRCRERVPAERVWRKRLLGGLVRGGRGTRKKRGRSKVRVLLEGRVIIKAISDTEGKDKPLER